MNIKTDTLIRPVTFCGEICLIHPLIFYWNQKFSKNKLLEIEQNVFTTAILQCRELLEQLIAQCQYYVKLAFHGVRGIAEITMQLQSFRGQNKLQV